jgi:hypothetical protein
MIAAWGGLILLGSVSAYAAHSVNGTSFNGLGLNGANLNGASLNGFQSRGEPLPSVQSENLPWSTLSHKGLGKSSH